MVQKSQSGCSLGEDGREVPRRMGTFCSLLDLEATWVSAFVMLMEMCTYMHIASCVNDTLIKRDYSENKRMLIRFLYFSYLVI